jgi:hypothetical protein
MVKLTLSRPGLCIMLFEQIHELVPSSPSLSHITRLSLQLTHLLDTYDPGTGSLLFVFTSTHAHQIGNRLKTQVIKIIISSSYFSCWKRAEKSL